MSLNKAINYMKLASSYISENNQEKALSCAMCALETIEKAGITPSDFDRIEIAEYTDEVESNQLSFEDIIKEARAG